MAKPRPGLVAGLARSVLFVATQATAYLGLATALYWLARRGGAPLYPADAMFLITGRALLAALVFAALWFLVGLAHTLGREESLGVAVLSVLLIAAAAPVGWLAFFLEGSSWASWLVGLLLAGFGIFMAWSALEGEVEWPEGAWAVAVWLGPAFFGGGLGAVAVHRLSQMDAPAYVRVPPQGADVVVVAGGERVPAPPGRHCLVLERRGDHYVLAATSGQDAEGRRTIVPADPLGIALGTEPAHEQLAIAVNATVPVSELQALWRFSGPLGKGLLWLSGAAAGLMAAFVVVVLAGVAYFCCPPLMAAAYVAAAVLIPRAILGSGSEHRLDAVIVSVVALAVVGVVLVPFGRSSLWRVLAALPASPDAIQPLPCERFAKVVADLLGYLGGIRGLRFGVFGV